MPNLRLFSVCVLLLAGCAASRPDFPDSAPVGALDDASRLAATRVAEIVALPAAPGAAEATLRATLARARAERRTVSIGGARHTMGGHSLDAGSLHVDMRGLAHMALDAEHRILRVGAGARWAEVVPYLDARGFSPAVMQSNNDFTVGGSLGANCHGWQCSRPPIASTVEAFRLMTAGGRVLRVSRTTNRPLFGLVIGGYGLFGVVLDVELRVIPNERYTLTREHLAPAGYPAAFARRVAAADAAVGMAYGRLSIAPGSFMREAILNVFTRVPLGAGEAMPPLGPDPTNALKRWLFLASATSDGWKTARWNAERLIEPEIAAGYTNRNQLLDESAEVYADADPAVTALLHEYFVPRERFAAFVARAERLIPAHRGNLLNVTVRDVARDDDAFLRYADQPMFALVMYFRQARTAAADARMAALTRDLIDAALTEGGRYYLPYRPHATIAQFDRAYPQGRRFFALKRRYDPGELFQNAFYRRYGRP